MLQIWASSNEVIGPCAVHRYRDSTQKYVPKVYADPCDVSARFELFYIVLFFSFLCPAKSLREGPA